MARRQSPAAPAPAAPALTMLPLPDERLAAVEPGPDVLMAPAAATQVEEWITGWAARERLEAAGVSPPGPMFLHGPPGTGKTAVTRMVARRFAETRRVLVVDAMRVTESYMGATSANISKAAQAALHAGAVLVLEEVDTLAVQRSYDKGGEVENARATTAIMRVLELQGPIILTSNRLDVIDPAVIRRCEYVLEMPHPTPEHRRAIIARELGADPGAAGGWNISLSHAISLARRARRKAVLSGLDAATEYTTLACQKSDEGLHCQHQFTDSEGRSIYRYCKRGCGALNPEAQ